MCNKSLSSGVFPERLKYATIKPVSKKGDKLLATNDRPISLLTYLSKKFEKLIYSRLYKHTCTNNILVKEQYGFRINGSSEAASFNEINEILKFMSNRFSVGRIFCDLKKASDCINHGIVVDKLQFYGISGKFLTLIQSYLKDTKKYSLIKLMPMLVFLLDGKVTNGAPQDPLLFVIYINALPKITDNDAKVMLFAGN